MGDFKSALLTKIECNKQDFPGLENSHIRASLLGNYVMERMTYAETLEEVREYYDTYRSVIHEVEI